MRGRVRDDHDRGRDVAAPFHAGRYFERGIELLRPVAAARGLQSGHEGEQCRCPGIVERGKREGEHHIRIVDVAIGDDPHAHGTAARTQTGDQLPHICLHIVDDAAHAARGVDRQDEIKIGDAFEWR